MAAGSFTVVRERDHRKMGEGPAGGSDGKDPASVAALTDVLATIIERAHTIRQTHPGAGPGEMPCDGLTAEGIVVIYQEIIRWYGEDDPAIRGLLEDILADEEEHADDAPGLPGS